MAFDFFVRKLNKINNKKYKVKSRLLLGSRLFEAAYCLRLPGVPALFS